MPTYLLHGFRWPRSLIRVHVVLQNLDDAAPEWLVAPDTTLALLKNFHQLYPECMEHLPRLRFVEQFDPSDTSAAGVTQPFAYVADLVEEIKLGVEIDEVRGRGLGNEQWAAVMELRDKIAPEEKVGWYIVVCGDEDRPIPPSQDGRQDSTVDNTVAAPAPTTSTASARQSGVPSAAAESPNVAKLQKKPQTATPEQQESKGLVSKLKSLRLGRRKSRPNLNESSAEKAVASPSSDPPPPLPTDVNRPQRANSDEGSSVPSIPPSATASTPPLPEDIAELPAITPTSSAGTSPQPDVDNFIPEIETKSKYARMSQIPDYRATWFPAVEPKAAHMPPIESVNATATSEKSERPASGRKFVPEKRTSLRRKSLNGMNEDSPRSSDASGMPRRSASPDARMGRRVMSFPNVRSGTVSPLTHRSISPAGRSGVVSPLARDHSPIRSGAVSPLTQEEQTPITKVRRRSTFQQRQQQQQQRRAQQLKLTTQMLESARPSSADSNEELEEVVVMSPVMRAPPKQFIRRSSTIVSPDGRMMSMPNLDKIVEGDKKPYFGQEVNPEDLVANNIFNAFERL